MDTEFKATYVEPDERVGAMTADEERDEKLTAQALGGIQGAERLSGFGRFVTTVQNLFRASKPTHEKRDSSHLKAAPIMMSAGLLLLFGVGLLFLVSKPESAVHSRFRPSTGLVGSDGKKSATNLNSEPAVSPDQLEGGGEASDLQKTNRTKIEKKRGDNASQHHFSFARDEHVANNPPPETGVQNGTSELQSPATVFLADSAANPVTLFNPHLNPQGSRQGQLRVPAGTEIAAHTTNAISSGFESPVIAIVDRNVELNDRVVIPQGARVIGYTAGTVKDRVNVRFTSIRLPNNRELAISGLALMKDGSAGLLGKLQGSGHPVLSGAARVGTGAAVVATEFAGQGSLNQPFSQADYLRNQMAAEVASEGSRLSNRFQQPMSIPIVKVGTNEPLRIFLLNALELGSGHPQELPPSTATAFAGATPDQTMPSEQALISAQTAYIQALEAQLADMHAARNGKPNGKQ